MVFVVFCRQNRAKCGSVVVANHTTPIDIVMLAVDNCFTLVSQKNSEVQVGIPPLHWHCIVFCVVVV